MADRARLEVGGFAGAADAQQITARVERLPLSRWHLQARVLVGAATFFDGVDALAIAYVLPVLADTWHLSPQRIGFLISAGYVGQLAGAVVSGWMAERIGRLATMIYTVTVYSVLSLLCVVSWDYWSLLAFRTIQGLGLGGEVPVAAAYVNESVAGAEPRTIRVALRGRFFQWDGWRPR